MLSTIQQFINIILLSFLCKNFVYSGFTSDIKYVDYIPVTTEAELCKGPRRIDYYRGTGKFIFDPTNGSSTLIGSSTSPWVDSPVQARVRLFKKNKDDRYELMLTYQSDNLCDRIYLVKDFVNKFVNVNSECQTMKDLPYNWDLNAFGKAIGGPKFFHGIYKVTCSFYTPNVNIFCLSVRTHMLDPAKYKDFLATAKPFVYEYILNSTAFKYKNPPRRRVKG